MDNYHIVHGPENKHYIFDKSKGIVMGEGIILEKHAIIICRWLNNTIKI